MTAPLIVGLAGTVLTGEERAFLAKVRPLGVILFRRNVADADQLAALVAEARAASGAGLVLVDQEGGRVQRIGPPLAPRHPPAAAIGALRSREPEAGRRAAWLSGRLIAADLAPYGINVPCLPVADVPADGAHDVIGDRAYAREPDAVATLAAAVAQGVLDGGALPVVKHVPGHGRARSDSHVVCPVVDASRAELERDLAPFRALAKLPLAMTAHVVYTALDATRPATLSPDVMALVREDIGFDGLLMTDDISMGALSGDVATDGAAALAAGCDCVLHCNGDLSEARRLADALPPLSGAAERRLAAALAHLADPSEDVGPLREEFASLVAVEA
ncbi:beta-N-acetylhexosaminidase [Acuticoccus sp.]|uniref:beta-N-acetylhexosaminidase n=1 Tax=Acuticoccus sp. TaxID=1904378 RepID=UPI003B524E38